MREMQPALFLMYNYIEQSSYGFLSQERNIMTETLYLLPSTPMGQGADNPGGKRTFEEREHDLFVEANLYLRGKSLQAIADEINHQHAEAGRVIHLSVKSIWKDLEEIHTRWVNSALVDYNAKVAKEVARVDQLEATYWEGWERSLQAKTIDEQQTIFDEIAFAVDQIAPVTRTKSRKKVEERDGTMTFLQGVERCIDLRCKILGLYSPEKYQVDWRVEAQKAGVPLKVASEQFESMVKQFTDAIEKNAGKEADTEPEP